MGPPAPGLNIGVPHDRSHTRAPPSRGGMQGSPIPRSRRGSPPPPFPGGYCCVSSLGSDTGVPRSPGTHATPHPEGHPKRATGVPHLGGGGAHTKEGLTQGTPPAPWAARPGGGGASLARHAHKPNVTHPDPAPAPPPPRCQGRPPAPRRTLRNVPRQSGASVRLPPPVYWGAAGGPFRTPPWSAVG